MKEAIDQSGCVLVNAVVTVTFTGILPVNGCAERADADL